MYSFSCPTCGAQVDFRFDDSLVRVCNSCRSAVVRTDRGAESLGRVADLMPIDSPLRLFSSGEYQGESFILVGMAQIRHEAGGVWQEWYAKFSGGKWGWLAEAQGRLYMTFERTSGDEPEGDIDEPGARVQLDGVEYVVSESGQATYVSAAGEIPYRLEPDTDFRFVDMGDGKGGFATIDLGSEEDEDDDQTIYVGRQVVQSELRLVGGEELPRGATGAPARQAQGGKLACPECAGSLELRLPDQTQRVGCPYCGSLIDVSTPELEILAAKARIPALIIPLGAKGTLPEGEMTVIGYLQRSANIDGYWYSFEEWLLHAPKLGFRWIVCSDGHWSYVQPVQAGAVDPYGKYDGLKFTAFQNASLRVDMVLGEMYWKVRKGEITYGQDSIAPPAMLSREQSDSEVNYSLSTYMTRKELENAFPSLNKTLVPRASGVAPNQPFPLQGLGPITAVLAIGLVVLGIVFASGASDREVHNETFTVQPGMGEPLPPAPGEEAPAAPAEAPGHILFSKPFTLDGSENIEISLSASLDNQWAYAAIDLVNDSTGIVIPFDATIEHYSGYTDGESWSEGDQLASRVIAPQPSGEYVVRLEVQHGAVLPMDVFLRVKQNVFRFLWWAVAAGLLVVVFGIAVFYGFNFHKRRMENSSFASSGDDD